MVHNLDRFEGEIAIFRFYETALNASQVSQNYDAITATGGGGLTVVSFDSTSVSGANVVVGSDGSFTYDSGALFAYLRDGESVVDTFTYTVQDSSTNTDTATVSITVNGITVAPTAITPASFNLNENIDTSSGASLGVLAATDEDSGESFTYTIVGGADAGVFSIGGAGSDELILTDGVLDFESQGSYSVIVRVTDSGGLTYDETLTVAVTNSNEAPTAITPTSFNLNENVDTSGGSFIGCPGYGRSGYWRIIHLRDRGRRRCGGLFHWWGR